MLGLGKWSVRRGRRKLFSHTSDISFRREHCQETNIPENITLQRRNMELHTFVSGSCKDAFGISESILSNDIVIVNG
jgi:hypothetical protein